MIYKYINILYIDNICMLNFNTVEYELKKNLAITYINIYLYCTWMFNINTGYYELRKNLAKTDCKIVPTYVIF